MGGGPGGQVGEGSNRDFPIAGGAELCQNVCFCYRTTRNGAKTDVSQNKIFHCYFLQKLMRGTIQKQGGGAEWPRQLGNNAKTLETCEHFHETVKFWMLRAENRITGLKK